uniref:Serine/arginine-rich splicing factor SR45a-like n=2 Tax=Nicotiana TaxID=4085 RepID=A0A1S4DFG8_TOBAC|nr:PREDICTED: uncharacterized protein LOC104221817 [Nicotiana sylvestris]XP_016512088.1 PREDICTED: uncharacterized protein LOC107829154 [Nicotiana tabacum]
MGYCAPFIRALSKYNALVKNSNHILLTLMWQVFLLYLDVRTFEVLLCTYDVRQRIVESFPVNEGGSNEHPPRKRRQGYAERNNGIECTSSPTGKGDFKCLIIWDINDIKDPIFVVVAAIKNAEVGSKFQTTATPPSRSPVRPSRRSPSRSPVRYSRRSISRSSGRVPTRVRPLGRSPSRGPFRSSRQSARKSSGRVPSRQSPSRSPGRVPSRIDRRNYSRSPVSAGRGARSPTRSSSRRTLVDGSPKRIRRGRGFSKRYSYVRRYRSRSPDRSPVRTYRYSDRYSRYRRSPRRYRSPPRGRTSSRLLKVMFQATMCSNNSLVQLVLMLMVDEQQHLTIPDNSNRMQSQ